MHIQQLLILYKLICSTPRIHTVHIIQNYNLEQQNKMFYVTTQKAKVGLNIV
jgi:hypothetical protein